jgi:hypothetical protein
MKLARAAILIALLLSAMTVAVLLVFDPPVSCPGWRLHGPSLTSLWQLLAVWTAPILVFHCFIVARWDWWLRRMAERESSVLLPNEYLLVRMCIVGAVTSQLPLLLVINCLGA